VKIDEWLADDQRQHYFLKREGFRWCLWFTGSDQIDRPLHPISGRFLRWVTAARMASSLNTAHNDGLWLGSELATRQAMSACLPDPEEAWSREALQTGELSKGMNDEGAC
jgi:hypothetical protein